MTDEEFVRDVARELIPHFGSGVVAATDTELKKLAHRPEVTRSFVESVKLVADISVIAAFLIEIAPVVRQRTKELSDKTSIKSFILTNVRRPKSLTSEAAEMVVEAAVKRAMPDN